MSAPRSAGVGCPECGVPAPAHLVSCSAVAYVDPPTEAKNREMLARAKGLAEALSTARDDSNIAGVREVGAEIANLLTAAVWERGRGVPDAVERERERADNLLIKLGEARRAIETLAAERDEALAGRGVRVPDEPTRCDECGSAKTTLVHEYECPKVQRSRLPGDE